MKVKRWDTFLAGTLGGVLSAIVGYLLLGSIWGWAQAESLQYFHEEVFVRSPLFKDRILSVCALSIVPAFHLAYRRRMDRFAKGTLFVMIALVMSIVWLQMGTP
ncbi:MAG: hypothetical protein CL849_06400 [Crocinitomicaceae bacterium]|nr:hypothetical protein [Crocinitomicaceae bacterium]